MAENTNSKIAMIYTDGHHPHWIRVRRYNSCFMAGTNNFDAYKIIEAKLNYRNTRQEAQDDLDALASRLGWEEVDQELVRRG